MNFIYTEYVAPPIKGWRDLQEGHRYRLHSFEPSNAWNSGWQSIEDCMDTDKYLYQHYYLIGPVYNLREDYFKSIQLVEVV